MNLPSSLTNSGNGSKEIELFSLPIVRRTPEGFKVNSKDERLTKSQGKRRDVNSDRITTTDDRGGIATLNQNEQDENKSNPLTPMDFTQSEKAFLTMNSKDQEFSETQNSSRCFNSRANSITAAHRQETREEEEEEDHQSPNGDGEGGNQRWYRKWIHVCKRHTVFIGPGIITCVGYTDPGNWVTDLAAGSQFGYKLLFVVLLSGLFGIFLQILAVRMGVVTGNDLARNTRILLLPDDEGQLTWFKKNDTNKPDKIRFRNARILTLWGLYLVSEGALIATELAELLGSAIALNLLFPGLPLYAGVLVTCADVMLFLFVYKPQGNFRIFEFLIASLVMIVLACYIALLVRTKPNWAQVFDGFVPSSTLVQPEALYTGIGIIGAVIMPHAMYLGSHFSTINRMDKSKNALQFEMEPEILDTATIDNRPWPQRSLHNLRVYIADTFSALDAHLRNRGLRRPGSRPEVGTSLPALPSSDQNGIKENAQQHSWPSRMSIREIKLHLPHAAWDIGLSLLFFAIFINSAILVVAGAAFYYGNDKNPQLGDLYDAFNLLKNTLGHVYAILFAIALLAAGQSASITCTLAGQLVSEGFIKWRTNAFLRRMITRVITAIPALAIAIGIGRNGLDEMLIASQVVLSFALPFVLVPLILITSMKSRMCIEDDVDQEAAASEGGNRTGEEEGLKDEKGKGDQDFSQQIPHLINNSPTTPNSADAIVLETPLTETISETMAINPATASSSAGGGGGAVIPTQTFASPKIIHNFTNHWMVIVIAVIIFLIIVIADVYTLVTLFLGEQ